MMYSVLIVEDESLELQALTKLVKSHTDRIKSIYQASDSVEALSLARAHMPDILLLDINLPGRSGFDICREIKRRSSVPVLVLTSRDQLKDELHALELGADEFLTKPCRRERLLARVANVLKRYEGRQNLIEGEGFLLDTQTYTLYIDGRSAVLPQNQGRIFETLMTNGGDVVSKEKLCEAVWGTSEYIDENALQVNLTRLKKTMAGLDIKAKIIAVRGVGYKLE